MPAQGSFQPSQTVAGRYRINTFLGGGETAEVYRAIDLVSGRDVALKVLCAGAPKDVELRASREFYYLSRFAHPGIVTALDFGTTPDGRPYFTTEFFDGRPFPEFFARGYERKLVDAAIQVLGALDAIHAQGLVHCDIKPANLLVQERDGNVMARLLDFGFAESISMSEPGEQRGTLGYVAPEVFKGIDPDARADLYSLGMVLYETITRRGPGVGSSLREWLKKQYYTDFEPPRSFDSQIPEEFEAVVLSLLRREPERRPRSAMAVIAELAGPGWQAATSDAPRRFLMAPGFIGRSTETDRLKTLLTGASRGRAGVICVSGERGVGKSRLLSEFRFLAQLEGATILACEPGSLGARQQSLIESVIGYLKLYLPSSVASVEESRAALSEETKYRLFEAVTQGLRELAASPAVKHSLVLLVDDFELFDPTSLEFLRYLAFSIDADRLVVLVAGLKEKRFLDLVGELERKSHFYHLSVTSMDHRDVDALVSSLLGPVPGVDELVDWMMRVTGGNPLFVIETVYALIDAKILLMRGTRWSIATELLEAYRPPDTVTEVVRRRLNNLTHEELEVLQVGAASAGPFTVDFLRAVLGFAENDLFNAIARLKSLGLLRNFAANHQSALILSSKILEAAVTERLSVVQRRENHRRVAQAMERLYADRLDELVFELAHHYTQAGIKDRAYAYLLKAGARARELRLTEQALSNFEVALAMSAQTVTPRERVGLIETVGTLREATGRYADAIEVYTQGISVVVADPELSADRPLMARFLQRMGHVHQKQARHADSINYFNQALLMQPDRTSVGYVDLLNDLGWSYCSAGNMARSEELLTQAMQLVEKLKATDPGAYLSLSARTFYYFSYLAWSRFDYVLALQLAERSLDGYESAHDELYMGHVSQFIAMLWWRRGDLAKAREYYERHLAAQRRSGDTFFLIRALTGLGAICQDEGKWDDANDFSASALGLAERIGDINSMAALNSNIGLVCEVRGDWDRARGFFDRALELQERMERDSRNDRGQILANIGLLHAKRGEAYEAERVFDELQVLADASQDLGFRFEVALNRAYALLKAERHDPAIRMLARALWLVRRERGQREFSLVHTVAAELRLAAGEPVRAEVEAVRALSLLSGRKSSR
jgi:tetratricopeptide (TPR) repeat protein/tRNA A-37 threonylcarbamoyl transferase component Bud32